MFGNLLSLTQAHQAYSDAQLHASISSKVAADACGSSGGNSSCVMAAWLIEQGRNHKFCDGKVAPSSGEKATRYFQEQRFNVVGRFLAHGWWQRHAERLMRHAGFDTIVLLDQPWLASSWGWWGTEIWDLRFDGDASNFSALDPSRSRTGIPLADVLSKPSDSSCPPSRNFQKCFACHGSQLEHTCMAHNPCLSAHTLPRMPFHRVPMGSPNKNHGLNWRSIREVLLPYHREPSSFLRGRQDWISALN